MIQKDPALIVATIVVCVACSKWFASPSGLSFIPSLTTIAKCLKYSAGTGTQISNFLNY